MTVTRQRALRLLRSERFLRQRVRAGATVRDIAADLGVHRTTVREWMRAHNINPTRR